jgi:hypothetical protein
LSSHHYFATINIPMKKAPVILLVLLLMICVFVGGIRYGQKVANTDAVVSYIKTHLKPSPTPSPLPLTGFKTYKNNGCGVQFLYPDSLVVKKDASDEAILEDKGTKKVLSVACPKGVITPLVTKVSTAEMTFKNKSLKVFITEDKYLTFNLRNPQNGRNIAVSLDKKLYELFENTLQYLP